MGGQYSLELLDQAGGMAVVESSGALAEIEAAVIGHCEENSPDPSFRQSALKARLRALGWQPEVRVPPFSEEFDDRAINDRYDAYKIFEVHGKRLGIAVELEGWEISNDLIKFRRGIQRGQIAAGVIIQPDPGTLRYCTQHYLKINGSLFDDLAVLFVAPTGPGLKDSITGKRTPKYKPFIFP